MQDTKQWIFRLVSLIIIVGALLGYQIQALQWEEQLATNQEEVAAAEAYNQEVQDEEARREAEKAAALAASADSGEELDTVIEEVEEEARLYIDGSYSGTGMGFGGNVIVTVTIADDIITGITVESADGEDASYFSMAENIMDNILAAQSADVDTISGATFSSTGIRDAVADALSQAKVG